ncbi:MAG: ORF6N domain-containing protein [Chitinophagales bacterium]|nr:ORF6N domain-containing protein [Chitinophagales bacterium]MCC6584821.1 ORF6N domain-containing protein [Chitinophagales bacterium]
MELELIHRRIHTIRGIKVILDYDLAVLYEVLTKNLNLAVKRNISRFPEDFMFQLTKDEFDNLRLQFETSSYGGRRYLPYAFTEQGVAMLSSVLNSKKAIDVNIAIMRTFVKMRQYALDYKELAEKLLEHDKQFDDVNEVLNYLMTEKKLEIEQQERRRIGFKI